MVFRVAYWFEANKNQVRGKMKVTSVQKITTVYYYVKTEDDFLNYRRSENGQWEMSMGESWEALYDEGVLEEAFQNYLAGQPTFHLEHFKPRLPLDDGVYHVEYVDADHVRLTKKASS